MFVQLLCIDYVVQCALGQNAEDFFADDDLQGRQSDSAEFAKQIMCQNVHKTLVLLGFDPHRDVATGIACKNDF